MTRSMSEAMNQYSDTMYRIGWNDAKRLDEPHVADERSAYWMGFYDRKGQKDLELLLEEETDDTE